MQVCELMNQLSYEDPEAEVVVTSPGDPVPGEPVGVYHSSDEGDNRVFVEVAT